MVRGQLSGRPGLDRIASGRASTDLGSGRCDGLVDAFVARRAKRREADLQAGLDEVVAQIARDEPLRRDPLGAMWTDGRLYRPTRELVPISSGASWPIVTPGCLSDAEASRPWTTVV